MKRMWSFIAVVIMVITIIPGEILYVDAVEIEKSELALDDVLSYFGDVISADEAEAVEAYTDEFSTQLSELLSEYDESYYSKIVIDVENNTIQKDSQEPKELSEYGIDYSCVQSDEPVIAVEPLLEMAGAESEIDSSTGEVSVVTDSGEEIVVDACTDEAKADGAVFFTAEQAEELFLEMEYEDGKITVTNPYQTKRLIVQTKNEKALKDDYSALKSITDDNGYYVLQFETEAETKTALEKLEKDKSVEYAVCDSVVSVYAIENRKGAEVIQSDRYKAYLAQNGKNEEVTVAVLDTGVDSEHSFLRERMLKGYNVYDYSSNSGDVNGHGTHVSGIIVDNTGENVKIMPVKSMKDDGNGSDLAVKLGIEYAVKNGADVINMSLGGVCPGENCQLCSAVKEAVKSGVTVVVAAGNETMDTEKICPGGIRECITVASATEDFNSSSTFSNFGEAVDLSAPGENIISCKPGGDYVSASGTSMATPFVAAAAAMLLTDDPGLTPAEVEATLISYCSDMLIKGWDKYSGNGLINFGIFFGDRIEQNKVVVPSSIKELLYFSKASPYYVSFSVYPEDSNAVLTDRSYTAESSDPSVAVFDGKYIWPKGEGECFITLTLPNGTSESMPVKVNKKEVWTDYAAESFAGGNGTEKSPYLISTPQQLAKLAYDVRIDQNCYAGCYFKLKNDIDLSGKYWMSIGGATKIVGSSFYMLHAPYGIVFDGNNHKIKNMMLFNESPIAAWGDLSPINSEWYMANGGLFVNLENCTVKNLGIENAVNYNHSTGLLAMYVYEDTYVSNCYTTGLSYGNGLFENIANNNVVIKNCYSSASVLKNGICSYICASTLEGGVKIHNVFFCGEHLGSDRSENSSGFASVIDAAENDVKTNIYNCFTVSETESGNGFSAIKHAGNIFNCYYNEKNSYAIKNDYSSYKAQLKGVSTSFFKVKNNFTNANNWHKDYPWDFENVWAIDPNINNGYPYLKNMKPEEYSSQGGEYWYNYAADTYAGGEGTKENPYLIETAEQFSRLAKMYRFGGGRNKYFKLLNDIDLSAHEWYPIGGAEPKKLDGHYFNRAVFSGNIDGNGKTVTGLKISSYIGYNALVAGLQQGSIKNLNVENAQVNSDDYGAILVGCNRVGGLIYNCSVSGTVTVKSENTGSRAGLICGANMGTSYIMASTAKGTVNGAVYCAGICGGNSGNIEGCYVTSFSSDCAKKSGIAFYSISDTQASVIKNCYSINCPIMYSVSGQVENTYQIADTSMIYYDNCLPSGSAKFTKAKMKLQQNYSGFDFENIWVIDKDVNSGYPYLKKIPEPEITELPTERWIDYAADSYAGGKGTEESPYLIATAEQLALLSENLSDTEGVYFKLIRDIDLGGKLWNSKYTGISFYAGMHFDGNGKTVSNVTVENGGGLFDCTLKGTIVNLNVENFIGNCSAGIVGANSGYIKNCHVKGNLSSAVYNNDSLYISEVGGICNNNYATIEQCSFEGALRGTGNVSGIAGWNRGYVINCFVKGDLGGGNSFISGSSDYKEEKCFSIEKNNRTSATIDNKYGIYKLPSAVSDKSPFKKASTFEKLDFENIWSIDETVNEGYPCLREPVSRTVSYVLNGGKNPQYVQNDYIPGNMCGLPEPTKEGYAFAGWYKDAELTVPAVNFGETDEGDATLYAKWGSGYTLIFDSNGGKGKMEPQLVTVGMKTALLKNTFVREEHDFMGWATEKNGKVVYKDGQEILNISAANTTLTLYAVWKAHSYTVKFDPNGGTGTMPDQIIRVSETATLRKNTFKKDKAIFMGWSTQREGTYELPDEAIITRFAEKGGTVVFYAIWNENTYTVKFNGNGGTGSMNDLLVAYDDLSVLPENKFRKKGYRLAGWSLKPGGSVYLTDRAAFINIAGIGKTVTLYAVWEKDPEFQNDYVVKYHSNGGEGTMKSQKILADKLTPLSKNKFKRKGYVFSGWSLFADGDVFYKNSEAVKNITKENTITLYAVWKEITYTVKFNANGGSGKMSSQKKVVYSGDDLKKNKFKPPKGKVFGGWALSKKGKAVYMDEDHVKALTDKNGATVTLYAKWVKVKNYKITYHANGGKYDGNPWNTYTSGKTNRSLPDFTRKGYTLVGWCTDKALKTTPITRIKPFNTGNLDLYAKWERNSYSVKFNAGGGSGTMKKQTGFKYGKSKALAKNTFKAPKGKVFAGWATKKNGKPVYTNSQKVKNLTSKNGKTVTLYAVWVTPKTYKIKYDTNGGKLQKSTVKTYKSGTGYSLPKPTRKGYTFVGWYTDSKLKTGKITVIKPWKTGTVKVYAKWKKN